jgi:hypothetical protein
MSHEEERGRVAAGQVGESLSAAPPAPSQSLRIFAARTFRGGFLPSHGLAVALVFTGVGIVAWISGAWRASDRPALSRPAEIDPTQPIYRADRSRRIRGTVKSQDGRPVAGARVFLSDVQASLSWAGSLLGEGLPEPGGASRCVSPSEASTLTDAEGYFFLDPPSLGLKTLSVLARGFQWTQSARFAVLDAIPQAEHLIRLESEIPVYAALSSVPATGRAESLEIIPWIPCAEAIAGLRPGVEPSLLAGVGPQAPFGLLYRGPSSRIRYAWLSLSVVRDEPKHSESAPVRLRLDGDREISLWASCAAGHTCPAREGGAPHCSRVALEAVLDDPASGASRDDAVVLSGLLEKEGGASPGAKVQVAALEGAAQERVLGMAESAAWTLKELHRVRGRCTSAEDGRFRIDGLAPSTPYVLCVREPEVPPRWIDVPPSKPGERRIDLGRLPLRPPSRVEIVSQFRPFELAVLESREGGFQSAAVTSRGGEGVLWTAGVGASTASLRDGWYRYYPKSVALRPGDWARVSFGSKDLRPEAEVLPYLEGFVLDPGRTPLRDVRVVCQAMRGPSVFLAEMRTDENGYYRIKQVPEGEPVMVGAFPAEENATTPRRFAKQVLSAHAEFATADLTVYGGSTRVTFLDARGRPWTRSLMLDGDPGEPFFMVHPLQPDSKGSATISGLGPGKYRLTARRTDRDPVAVVGRWVLPGPEVPAEATVTLTEAWDSER